MNTTVVVSSAEPTLFLCSKPNKSSTKQVHETISFTSQLTKSRIISIKNQPGSSRARTTTRIHAMYAAPAAEAETLYELLGIAESVSSVSDIKKAYKKMARKYHPDVSPPDRVDEYTRRFIMMHEAYETLSDPRSRASYDRDLAAGFGFSFSATKSRQEMEETEEWKMRWQSQLNELKRREVNRNSSGRMSWGDRMRSQA